MVSRFRTKLDQGMPIGTWLMSGAPATAEALGHAGFDFLVLDMEHVPVDTPQAIEHLRAIGNTAAVPVVRVPWNDLVWIKRVMDAGAETVMIPFVQTVAQAEAAARAMRYPPVGQRGVAAMHRASRYGADRAYLQTANDRAFLIVQLETPEAIANLTAIANVAGVDGLFVGPGDLSAAMGHMGDIGHADVQNALVAAVTAARAAGLPVGILAPNLDMAKRFVSYGYNFVAVASDLAMLTGRAAEILTGLASK